MTDKTKVNRIDYINIDDVNSHDVIRVDEIKIDDIDFHDLIRLNAEVAGFGPAFKKVVDEQMSKAKEQYFKKWKEQVKLSDEELGLLFQLARLVYRPEIRIDEKTGNKWYECSIRVKISWPAMMGGSDLISRLNVKKRIFDIFEAEYSSAELAFDLEEEGKGEAE